jgi:hypothetical protein
MIDLEYALYVHKGSIIDFGGVDGIRDEGALLAALARPMLLLINRSYILRQ